MFAIKLKMDDNKTSISDEWCFINDNEKDDASLQIELPNIYCDYNYYNNIDTIQTSISCSTEAHNGIYTININIYGYIYVFKTGNKNIADFIMKNAVKLGYFQIKLMEYWILCTDILDGNNSKSRAMAIFISNKLFGVNSYYNDDIEYMFNDK
jgi:hypothetical protein